MTAAEVAAASRSVAAAFPALSMPGLAIRHGTAIFAATGAGSKTSVASEGDLAVVFEGELSNRAGVISRLGLEAVIVGDAELALAAFRAWGRDAAERLDGSFAFAVHDRMAGTLFCARDHVGRVPLHYAMVGGAFAFASTLPALLGWRAIRRRANSEVLAHILSFGYVPPDHTAFEGVSTLEGGCALHLDAAGEITHRRYWSLPAAASVGQCVGLADPAASKRKRQPRVRVRTPRGLIRELSLRLRQACAEAERIPDSPEAVLIFGDKTGRLLTSRARKSTILRPRFDRDSLLAGEAVLYSGRDLLVGPAALAAMPQWIWDSGAPTADPAIPVQHAVLTSSALRKLAITVDTGGDELLLARPDYTLFASMLEQLRNNPGAFRNENTFYAGQVMARDLFQLAAGYFNEADRLELSGPALMHTLAFAPSDELGIGLEAAEAETALDMASRLDFARRMPAGAATALWSAAREADFPILAPFLGRGIAEWCAAQSQADRMRLVECLAPLPQRNPAAGVLPIDRWLRTVLRGFTRDTIASSAFRGRGLYNLAYVDRIVEQFFDHGEATGRLIWPLLCMETWFKTFVDRVPTAALPPLDLEGGAGIFGAA